MNNDDLKRVWDYINKIPKDPLDNSIDIEYHEHCTKLGINELEFRRILKIFESKGLINLGGSFDGAIIMFLR